MRTSVRALLATGTIATVVAGVLSVAQPAGAAASGFTAGDVVVYRVGSGSGALTGNGAAVFLDEYSPAGSLVQSVPLPTAASGANKPLVASSTATSEGLLNLSADGRYLLATGYDAAVGTAGLTSSAAASVPRTVARVDASDTVNTTTALTDFADGNNPRSATSADGSQFWVGGAAGGVRYASVGASTSTALTSTTYKNVRDVQDVGGQLYTSADPTKAAVTIATVGTGLPTSGTQPVTNLNFKSAPTQPYQYSLLTLGTGSAPDTLYVADNSAGAVVKYSLVSGTWTATGSVAVAGIAGLTANDVNGVVTVYASASNPAGTSGSLYSITDSSGSGGTLSGSASLIATAPTNEAFRGVAFTPGTVIGSGGAPPASTPPTITPAYAGLPAALGDPTNPTDAVTVGDTAYAASRLTTTATSSNQSVAADSGITLSGSGATRTLSVTPAGSVGDATITLAVTAPDGTSATTTVSYAVSADVGQSSARYYSGAGNASAAVDVGNGYALLADDENNLLRLYNTSTSGPPVKTFDFTSVFPFGSTEIDLETAARSGNTIYWSGSMSNTSGGNSAPSRSTIFATRITGTGANTALTYLGSYTGLRADLISWDQSNGNVLGLAASGAAGLGGHDATALNMEGMEFVGNSTSTVYLSFRAPLEPTSNRHLALLVPLTNVDAITTAGNPGSVHATFGQPVELDLGGLGVRDIKENADGQYLIIAGTADDSNTSFVLYTWDGNPNDTPQPSTTLPQLPSASNAGSWETIVSVPEPLTGGSPLELVQDDGTVAWYGDGLTTKTGLQTDLQKSLGVTFSYAAPAPRATSTTVSADSAASTAGHQVTYTATVAPTTGSGTPTGTVEFTDGGSDISGCSAQPVSGGAATCTTTYTVASTRSVTAAYSGDANYTASTSAPVSHEVDPAGLDHLTVSPTSAQLAAGSAQAFTAEGYDAYGNDLGDVTSATTFSLTPASGGSTSGAVCNANSCTATSAGSYDVAAGDGTAAGSATLTVLAGPVATLSVSPDDTTTTAGTAVAYTAAGYDAYGNPTGDETAAASFGITPLSDGSSDGASCAAASCSATIAGSYTVAAAVPTTSGTATGSTTLGVLPGPVAGLTLTPPSASIETGQTQSYQATGSDAYGNSVGDVTAQTTFGIDGTGTCTTTACGSSDPGSYTVTGTDGTASGTATLAVTDPTPPPPSAPSVTSLQPASGSVDGGTQVTVYGSGFSAASGVLFGSGRATDVTVISDTQLTAVSPKHSAKVVDVLVTTPAGTSPPVDGDRFSYERPQAATPTVTSIAPRSGPASGGTPVTIKGSGFTAAATVQFGSTPAPDVTFLSATRLRAVSPALAAGVHDVTVTDVGGTSTTSNADEFTAAAAAPAISAVAPSSGPSTGGTTVTITGTGFAGATAVRFGTAPASNVTTVSDTRVTAVSPAHAAGAVTVSVIAPTGTSSSGSPAQYTFVTPPPAVVSLKPSSGPIAGGTHVTVRGAGFTGATQVSFGGVAAQILSGSAGKIVAVAPAASAPGAVDVVVTTPSGVSATGDADMFTYTAKGQPTAASVQRRRA